MIANGLRWTVRRYGHSIGCSLIVTAGIVFGAFLSLLASSDRPWPYDVFQRRIVAEKVHPGEEGALAMQRLIEYHEEDCWRQYDRRVVSQVKTGPRAGMVFRPMSVVEQKLPVELSGKWQTWSVTLPDDFPCGPAYIAETVTAACTWFQRNVKRLRKPDIITPFEVVGCP